MCSAQIKFALINEFTVHVLHAGKVSYRGAAFLTAFTEVANIQLNDLCDLSFICTILSAELKVSEFIDNKPFLLQGL